MVRQLLITGLLFFTGVIPEVSAQDPLAEKCGQTFAATGECPSDLCALQCVQPQGDVQGNCLPVCAAKSCLQIKVDHCPLEFCAIMEDCAGQKICHYKMLASVQCGDLAYSGQDVECCDGLVKRCGIEFYDHTCDMEGKNSAYNLPICIPCGDGTCGQFENLCNCPEDCGLREKWG